MVEAGALAAEVVEVEASTVAEAVVVSTAVVSPVEAITAAATARVSMVAVRMEATTEADHTPAAASAACVEVL